MTPFNRCVLSSTTRMAMPVATFPGAKAVGRKIIEMVTDPRIQAEVSMDLRKRVGIHFYQCSMDLTLESEAFGAQVHMEDMAVPSVTGRLVTDAAGIDRLAIPKVGDRRTGVSLETVRILARQPGQPFVLGGCCGPYTLAGRLFGVSESLEFTMSEPEAMEALVEKVTVFLIEYVKAFKAAGANALFMAEPTAGLLSPKMLGRFSSPFVKRIVDAVQDDSFGIILHNCGAKVAHLPAILQSGATAHHFGKPMDLAAAAKQVPADVVVCGNLDPSGVFVGCSPEAITAQTKELCASVKDCRNVVLSSGCDLQSNTPVENIQAFMRAVS